jgi:hypothetical protein
MIFVLLPLVLMTFVLVGFVIGDKIFVLVAFSRMMVNLLVLIRKPLFLT